MNTRVFVYGTLLRGESNERFLRSARLVGAARTRPAFTLYDLGAFPGLVEGGSVAVTGEVYEVSEETLAALDRLEGHPTFYRRTAITLDGGALASAYLLPLHHVEGRAAIPGGCWRTYRKDRWR